MQKLTIKLFFLGLVSVALVYFGDQVFKDKHFYRETVALLGKEDNFKVFILGSSKAHTNYDPRIFETGLGLKTINLGAPAQKLETTQAVLEHAFKDQQPTLLIVDIFSHSISPYYSDKHRNEQLLGFNQIPLSWSKNRELTKIYGYRAPKYLSATLINHKSWNELISGSIFQDPLFNGIDYFQGFRSYFRKITPKQWEEFIQKNRGNNELKKPVKLSEQEKEKINAIVSLSKQENCTLVFVNSPTYVADVNARLRAYTAQIAQYLKSQNLSFFDINSVKDSIGLNKSHYSDPNHLNPFGAKILSEFLINQLKQQGLVKAATLREDQLKDNRYYQFNNHFKDALLSAKIAAKAQEELNSDRIYILKNGQRKLDLVVKVRDTSKLKLAFEIVTQNKIIKENLDGKNLFLHQDSYYLVYPFNHNKPDLRNLEVYLGPKRQAVIILKNGVETSTLN